MTDRLGEQNEMQHSAVYIEYKEEKNKLVKIFFSTKIKKYECRSISLYLDI